MASSSGSSWPASARGAGEHQPRGLRRRAAAGDQALRQRRRLAAVDCHAVGADLRRRTPGCAPNSGPPTRTAMSRLQDACRTARDASSASCRQVDLGAEREADHVEPLGTAPAPAASAPAAQAPPVTSQPARRKNSPTITRPKVCCSPGLGSSSTRRPSQRCSTLRPERRAQLAQHPLQPAEADRDVGEVAQVVFPQLAEVARRRRQQVEVDRLDRDAARRAARRRARSATSSSCASTSLANCVDVLGADRAHRAGCAARQRRGGAAVREHQARNDLLLDGARQLRHAHVVGRLGRRHDRQIARSLGRAGGAPPWIDASRAGCSCGMLSIDVSSRCSGVAPRADAWVASIAVRSAMVGNRATRLLVSASSRRLEFYCRAAAQRQSGTQRV